MAKKKKLILISEVSAGYDSVAARQRTPRANGQFPSALDLLQRCQQAWENLRSVRDERQRVMNYCFGDQWSDIIEWKDDVMTEREFISRRGDVALTNNIMISILNSVAGLYSKQQTEPVCFARASDAQSLSDIMSATIQQNWQDTSMPVVLRTIFEDALIGGVSIARESYEVRDGKADAWTEYVNPAYCFWEAGSDPRYKDLRLIGVLHDMSQNELYRQFANARYGWTVKQINEIFAIPSDDPYDGSMRRSSAMDIFEGTGAGIEQNDRNKVSYLSFSSPSDSRLFRVIEVWTKETKRRLQCHDPIATSADDALYRIELSDKQKIDFVNLKRKQMYAESGFANEEVPLITYEEIQDEFWYYTYMAPDGTILCEGETPYDFKSHPFTLKLFPYVNGEIHSFMSNVVDQQRYINRLIVMHDMAARSSAKGITIVPMDCIPDNMSPRDFADQFTAYDGLIFYNTARRNPNLRPEIITSNAVQIGTTELLNMEMQLIRDITNVSGALQGKTPTSGTSAARYSLETQNSTTALYSVFADMTVFTEEIAKKKCAVIKQYYPDHCYVLNKDMSGILDFSRLSVEDVMFKISIKESAATAAYQSYVNDTLKEFLQMGLIDLVQYLRNAKVPFADSLLQQIMAAQQEQQQQQIAMQQQMQQQGAQQQALPAQQ